MKTLKDKLTLFNAVRYEIKAIGKLDKHYSEWDNVESIRYRHEDGICTMTILTCTVDQAALLGIIRRLYNYGLPLVTVRYIES